MISCSNDDDSQSVDDNSLSVNDQINEFIFNGLNTYYLFKDDQPLLNRSFDSVNQGTPEDFFELLTVAEDRFSFIVDDFEDLENSFAGISLTDGIDFGLARITQEGDDVIATVNYVANNSPAQLAGVKRGDLFTSIDGINMTVDNFVDLLNLTSYTLELLVFDEANEELVVRDIVDINKEQFTENPIHINKIIEHDGLKIGYLMYNSFNAGSENELNTIFGEFASAGINELVLDLRYNGGGRISTAVDLCGMITGQYDNEIIISEQWNSELQAQIQEENPEFLYSRFRSKLTDDVTPLNSLGLNNLYVISSKGRTASASELVINGLDAYINVVHIGDAEGTVGKSQASVTLYDSDNLFSKDGISSRHKYAIQPLIYTSVNNNGFIVPNEGLTPDVFINEDSASLGVLGEVSEPLLEAALNAISGSSLAAKQSSQQKTFGEYVGCSKINSTLYQKMY